MSSLSYALCLASADLQQTIHPIPVKLPSKSHFPLRRAINPIAFSERFALVLWLTGSHLYSSTGSCSGFSELFTVDNMPESMGIVYVAVQLFDSPEWWLGLYRTNGLNLRVLKEETLPMVINYQISRAFWTTLKWNKSPCNSLNVPLTRGCTP